MEVFLRNMPPDLTDHGFRNHLAPFMKTLHINDWHCLKPRKKSFGTITFLLYPDGQRFLQQHGEEAMPFTILSKPQFKARLTIMGRLVYCNLSKKQADPFLLKSLAKSAEDRCTANELPVSTEDEKIAFHSQTFSCGVCEYLNGQLVYSPEVEWPFAAGIAKFVKKAFILEYKDGNGATRIEIPYRTIENIVATSRPTALVLTLWETPRFFGTQAPDIADLMAGLMQNINKATKRRLTGLPGTASSYQKIIGQALVYRICVSPVDFYELSNRLVKRDVLTVIRHDLAVLPSYRRRSLQTGFKLLNQTIQEMSHTVPFAVIFQLEALARNGFLPPWTVQELLLKIAARITEQLTRPVQKLLISAEAVRKLISQVPFPGIDIDASVFDIEEIWKYLEQNEQELQNGFHKELISNLTMVHKVNVTPTGITLHGPDPEAKNRILRRFPTDTEYFVRVQFSDEDGSALQFNSRVSNEDVYDRFRQVMNNGVAICGRVYGFLGYSHSSLRSHSAWFMAPFWRRERLETYLTVIPQLGRFEDITSPARCAARIGQAFSETPFAISLYYNGVQHNRIPDVMTRDGDHMFSDGVGTISRRALEAIRDAVLRGKAAATCFQIRWGGAKGMLALDERLEGTTMNIRESMVKFESNDIENLEICDAANKPIQMVLNRQLIKILEDMRVPAAWFLKQQDATLRYVTAHISNTAGFLKRQNIADRLGFPQLIRYLESIGIDYKRDRFMRSVVETAVLRELRLMKYKARIPIEQGVTLFGIMDETGYLEEGEIFVTFDEAQFIGCHPLVLDNRRMLVTRSPALHPGDIQMATNIIPPEHHPLRALRNCIVFSQKGERDLPSCLSGGDLDGDVYSVIWDPEAVSGCPRISQPAGYERVDPVNIGRRVEKKDMTNFFIQFMATDQLGLIATRHMILADQRSEGTADPDCVILAELHSTGVDYSKTGIPVSMDKFKNIRTNRYRPHFLAPAGFTYIKDRTQIEFDVPTRPREDEVQDEDDNSGPQYLYYRSKKINGVLFDAIDERNIWYKDIKGDIKTDGAVWADFLKLMTRECKARLGGIRWAHLKDEAFSIRGDYEDAIFAITQDYSSHPTQPLTELEVFTGNIFSTSGVQTRRQRDRSLQLKDEFDRIARWTENLIRRRTTATSAKPDDASNAPEDPMEALKMSIACLEASQLKGSRGNRFTHGRWTEAYHSFKIISACCVVRELNAADRRAEAEEWY
ncbi:RdRP-domain-containing protein [Paraphaeosphaeria sporulosa]|uniref:RNA-dependent RNA polymerase n=1 Tax=Paraphaeosphaeria sporulosa TaxID=1460663 RepID=A0A177CYV5_9PLEO|nr:RdRP-domain-containing protein [Paraphaeosphaeria sporulosa]OAG12010.1 RdRP-domain-containing protein [Paraphaeosphaeria sporulosa]